MIPGGPAPAPAPTAPSNPIVNQLPPAFKPGGPSPPNVVNQLPPSLGFGSGGNSSSGNPYASDPGYQASLAQEQLGIGQQNAALNNLIQQRIINYGDPALASQAGFGLDPQAAAFARQNYLSGNAQLARIDKQHKQNLQAIINQLAGHGLVFSGETGYQTGQEDQGYGNTVYDAQQQALNDILGYRQSTAQNEQNLHQGVIDALQQAYQNYLNHPELGGYGAGNGPGGGFKQPPAIVKATKPSAAQVKKINQIAAFLGNARKPGSQF